MVVGVPKVESSGIVPSMLGTSERGPQAINGIWCVTAKPFNPVHSRFVGPGNTVSTLPAVVTKLLLSFGSMPVAVPSITANPDPVRPEWPHTEPGMTAVGNVGQ